MSHPERYAGAAIGPNSHLGTGSLRPSPVSDYEAKAAAENQQPQLHQIGHRLEGLVCRLTDANLASRMFVSRVAGMRPESVSGEKGGVENASERPTTQALLILINNLEQRVSEAEYLARELGRIG